MVRIRLLDIVLNFRLEIACGGGGGSQLLRRLPLRELQLRARGREKFKIFDESGEEESLCSRSCQIEDADVDDLCRAGGNGSCRR